MPSTFTKDPSALLDYVFDWSAWLGSGETIASTVITVPTGLTLDLTAPHTSGYTATTTAVTVWLSGGTAGSYYSPACKITTSAGRVDERSITVQVQDR